MFNLLISPALPQKPQPVCGIRMSETDIVSAAETIAQDVKSVIVEEVLPNGDVHRVATFIQRWGDNKVVRLAR